MPEVFWTDLGRRGYRSVWELQHRLVDQRKGGAGVDRLLLVEHEPILTLGRRAKRNHVLADDRCLADQHIEVVEVERAGDVTYHGPGQLVIYPIMDLRAHRKDVRWFSCRLLTAVATAVTSHGLEAHVRLGRETGVWTGPQGAPGGKIAAMGVRIERWITYHGVALNVHTDLSCFDWIVPCGLPEANVVSISSELGRSVSLEAVRPGLLDALGAEFQVELIHDPQLAAVDHNVRAPAIPVVGP